MTAVYEICMAADRPMWPPGAEAQAQAYDEFEAWRKMYDPEGELSILDAIELYANSRKS